MSAPGPPRSAILPYREHGSSIIEFIEDCRNLAETLRLGLREALTDGGINFVEGLASEYQGREFDGRERTQRIVLYHIDYLRRGISEQEAVQVNYFGKPSKRLERYFELLHAIFDLVDKRGEDYCGHREALRILYIAQMRDHINPLFDKWFGSFADSLKHCRALEISSDGGNHISYEEQLRKQEFAFAEDLLTRVEGELLGSKLALFYPGQDWLTRFNLEESFAELKLDTDERDALNWLGVALELGSEEMCQRVFFKRGMKMRVLRYRIIRHIEKDCNVRSRPASMTQVFVFGRLSSIIEWDHYELTSFIAWTLKILTILATGRKFSLWMLEKFRYKLGSLASAMTVSATSNPINLITKEALRAKCCESELPLRIARIMDEELKDSGEALITLLGGVQDLVSDHDQHHPQQYSSVMQE